MKHVNDSSPFVATAGILLAVALSGCSYQVHPLTGAADRMANETVCPEYLDYVDADTNLDDFQKSLRHKNVDEFRAAVAEAKGGE